MPIQEEPPRRSASTRKEVVPDALLNSTLHLSILRLVWLSALVCFILRFVPSSAVFYDGSLKGEELALVPLLPFLVIHHGLYAPVMVYSLKFPIFLDLTLVLTEFAVMVYYLQTTHSDRFAPQYWLVYLGAWWILTIGLAVLAFLRIVLIIAYSCGWGLTSTVLISSVRKGSADGEGTEKKMGWYKVLLGRAIWEYYLPGEGRRIRVARGIATITLVIGLGVFALLNMLVEPIRETTMTPITDYRGVDVSWDFKLSDSRVLNVVITRLVTVRPNITLNRLFSQALNVTPLWDGDGGPACIYVSELSNHLELSERDFLQAVVYHCPPRPPPESAPKRKFANIDSLYLHPILEDDYLPDIQVIVNFTALPRDPYLTPQRLLNSRRSSVQAMLGYINDTERVIQRTVPMTVPRGLHLIASTSFTIRREFKTPSAASWGMFASRYTYPLFSVESVFNDPHFPRTFPDLATSQNISSVRIQVAADYSEYVISQEHRANTVLKGLIGLGGLWTSLGGMFVLVFGNTIMRTLFGAKPISVFGLVHNLQSEQIKSETLKNYPNLLSTVTTEGRHGDDVDPKDIISETATQSPNASPTRGHLEFIFDQLIDWGMFVDDGTILRYDHTFSTLGLASGSNDDERLRISGPECEVPQIGPPVRARPTGNTPEHVELEMKAITETARK